MSEENVIELMIKYIRQETNMLDNDFVSDKEIIHYINKYKLSDVIKAIRVKQDLDTW